MILKLKFPLSLNVRVFVRAYDPELEDIRSILTDICRAIETSGEFIVSGFGDNKWPVDVGTDLAVFLEQLPDVLNAIRVEADTEIDFYEQGIERTITLTPDADGYFASCISRTKWQPNPRFEKIDLSLLRKMLIEFRDEFVRIMRLVAPELYEHPWMKSWLIDVLSELHTGDDS